jgi:hypothetical protein
MRPDGEPIPATLQQILMNSTHADLFDLQNQVREMFQDNKKEEIQILLETNSNLILTLARIR